MTIFSAITTADTLASVTSVNWEKLDHVATTLALVVSLVIFIAERRTHNRLLRVRYLVEAQDKFDSICAIRSKNPDFILIGQHWKPKQFDEMNGREVSYYHYIEMTLGFIETYVYLTYVAKILSRKMFFEFIEPMIWLEVSYNIPAFEHFAKARSISPRACAFLQFTIDEMKSKSSRRAVHPDFNVRLSSEIRTRYDFSNEGRLVHSARLMKLWAKHAIAISPKKSSSVKPSTHAVLENEQNTSVAVSHPQDARKKGIDKNENS